MSEKEKGILDVVYDMPEAVRNKFMNMAEGAAAALDALKEKADGQTDGGGA